MAHFKRSEIPCQTYPIDVGLKAVTSKRELLVEFVELLFNFAELRLELIEDAFEFRNRWIIRLKKAKS